MKPIDDIFRHKVFKMLKEERKIGDVLINKLLMWEHSGFSIHNGVKVARDDEEGREALAQYIIRNTFALEKLKYIKETGKVIYHPDIQVAPKSKRIDNF